MTGKGESYPCVVLSLSLGPVRGRAGTAVEFQNAEFCELGDIWEFSIGEST
jgi:hypothetical protein